MATLDYAFLADYAKVEPTGTLTAVSASWTHLDVPRLPAAHRLAVAGRVRAKVDDDPIPMRVEFLARGGVRLAAEFQLEPSTHARPYGDGMVGHLFAVEAVIPLAEEGLYEVLIFVDGGEARRLAFDVSAPPAT